VLLVGAGLMLRSFLSLGSVDLGFRPDHVLTMRISLPEVRYSDGGRVSAFYRDLLGRVAALPSVQSVAATNHLPFVSDFAQMFTIEGSPAPAPGEALAANCRGVTPGYFDALRIPLRQGRLFTEQDGPNAPRVVIVDEILARRHWPEYPGEDGPVGRRIALGRPRDESAWRTIVGVVSAVRHRSLDAQLGSGMYVPYFQAPEPAVTLVARTASEPAQVASAIRAQVRAIDKDQPVSAVRTMEQLIAESIADRRAVLVLLGAFALLALVLAAVGTYGVISCSVAQRAGEIGVRMALGAQPGDVLRMVLGQALALALGGVVIGSVAALALSRGLSRLLYGVTATDPAIFAAVGLLLMAVAVLAAYVPARSAARGDPARALKAG
jgi:putative ABC transport system permease protein